MRLRNFLCLNNLLSYKLIEDTTAIMSQIIKILETNNLTFHMFSWDATIDLLRISCMSFIRISFLVIFKILNLGYQNDASKSNG